MEDSTQITKNAMYDFLTNPYFYGVHDDFIDFLMKETGYGNVIPHYFKSLFDNEVSRSPFKLGLFLYSNAESKSPSEYVNQTEQMLKGIPEAEAVFSAYHQVRALKPITMESVRKIVSGIEGLEEWPQMF